MPYRRAARCRIFANVGDRVDGSTLEVEVVPTVGITHKVNTGGNVLFDRVGETPGIISKRSLHSIFLRL